MTEFRKANGVDHSDGTTQYNINSAEIGGEVHGRTALGTYVPLRVTTEGKVVVVFV